VSRSVSEASYWSLVDVGRVIFVIVAEAVGVVRGPVLSRVDGAAAAVPRPVWVSRPGISKGSDRLVAGTR
jgi:hypothetical protein